MDTPPNAQTLRAIFDALPLMAFVVDEHVRVLEYNEAASALIGDRRMAILRQRAGDVMHCLHSTDTPQGCGTGPSCADCVVRNSVNDAFAHKCAVRRRARLELVGPGKEKEIFALVTASPFTYEGQPRVMLLIEDISDIAELGRIIPICDSCKKVRHDKEAWVQVEAYLHEHWGATFTHRLCPECHKTKFAELETFLDEQHKPGKKK